LHAVEVQAVTKRYRIGESWRPTLRDALGGSKDRSREFWALRGVTFDVEEGEVVGVIGRNGAGKTTLLKLLARITEPTAGVARMRGRVGALLEVGTGFHPELTGRENVFLNGAILGMRRAEIRRKFDEIVAFAEVERFIDTPVKRYSSGMQLRLAFAVAAHLEPEILVVDEVLAVGDAPYQRKCVNRMRELARGGRTILFVSHNMDLVPRLCTRVVHLDRGRVVTVGPAGPTVDRYLADLAGPGGDGALAAAARTGDGRARFAHVRLDGPGGVAAAAHRCGADLTVVVTIDAAGPVGDVDLAVNLRTVSGTKVYSAWTPEQGVPVTLRPGRQTIRCTFRRVRLRPGRALEVELWMASGDVLDHVPEALRVPVIDGPDSAAFSNSADQGIILTDVTWAADPEPAAAAGC
jgi:lipopolysaccharide transport system ATP-binding protein